MTIFQYSIGGSHKNIFDNYGGEGEGGGGGGGGPCIVLIGTSDDRPYT